MTRSGKFSKSLFAISFALFFSFLALPAWADKDLDDHKEATIALVARYETSSGRCPSVSCTGTLCAAICCPCCIPCIAGGVINEICSLPSTRVVNMRVAARESLLAWKNTVILSRSSDEKVQYNEFVKSHANAKSPYDSALLFVNQADMESFLIQQDIQNSIPSSENMLRILEQV